MSDVSIKKIIYPLTFVALVIAGMSLFAGVPYIYTLCGLSLWAAVGHAITLDDDKPSGWGNMEKSKRVLDESRVELLIKVLISIVFIVLAAAVPSLSEYGS